MRNPKHILITGASSGLGAALAIDYATKGTRLSLHGRNEQRLAAVALVAERLGAIVTTKTCDVTDDLAMAAWITSCDQNEHLDLVIANAGISASAGRGFEHAKITKAIFDTNLQGVFNTVNPAVRLMINRGYGQIAIMSSLASFRGFAGSAAYCASKAAVRIYGEALRTECADQGIEVNVICPGFVKTPMTDANGFAMPFLLSAWRAATIIRRGLAANKARIAFPWQLYSILLLLTALPQGWTASLTRRLPRK